MLLATILQLKSLIKPISITFNSCHNLLSPQQKILTDFPAHSSNANNNENSSNADVAFFELSTVIAATNNFSSANKLGQGGFGPVYKSY
ncbi:hypothetical protein ACOSQ2_012586 [Xanthoceras sorbifolium]